MSAVATFETAEALLAATGVELGATEWQELTQEHIEAFAGLTGDHQWIHVDPARAATEGPFGGTIAHGALTLALVPVFVGRLLQVPWARMVVNGGFDRARLRAPVPSGAKIRGVGSVHDVVDMGAGLRVVVRTQVEVLGETGAACTADQVMVVHG